jgi:hypothetical protein
LVEEVGTEADSAFVQCLTYGEPMKAIKVSELLKELEAIEALGMGDLDVWTEGCDCEGESSGARIDKETAYTAARVLICRSDNH